MSNIEEFKNVPELSLINTNAEELLVRAIQAYEEEYKNITGDAEFKLQPADKERILLNSAVYLVALALISGDVEYKQGMLKYAKGPSLDNIGLTRGSIERPEDKSAIVNIKYSFEVTDQQITIPTGARVSCGNVYFATTEEYTAPIGATEAELVLTCTETGEIGNGFTPGTITTITDPIPYVKSCTNTTTSQGGVTVTDDDYTRKIYNTPETYSVAGPRQAYEAKVKEFNENITDVCVTTPDDKFEVTYTFDNNDAGGTETIENKVVDVTTGTIATEDSNISAYTCNLSDTKLELTFTKPVKKIEFELTRGGIVDIYALLKNGAIPTETFNNALQAFLSDEKIRPLTDKVEVKAPTEKEYEINFEYYIDSSNRAEVTTIKNKVAEAVDKYISWQNLKLKRDINPDELTRLVKEAGAKRLVITKPVYTKLKENEVAKLKTKSIEYKGLE